LASVVRADLAAQEAISGTIGYEGQYTILGPVGTAAQALAQAQQTQATDRLAVAADQTALNDTSSGNVVAIGQQQGALNGAQAVATADQTQLRQDQAQQAVDQHTLDGTTTKQAAEQAQLASDTTSQRSLQQTQLADQQQLAALQARVASEQSTIATTHDQNALTADQTTLTADQAALANVQQRLNNEATALQQAGFAVTDDQAAAQQDATGVNAAKAAVTADEAKVAADQTKVSLADPAAVANAQSALAGAEVSALRNLHQAQAKRDTDSAALQAAQSALDTAQSTALGSGTTLTWIPQAGQTVVQGQPVYAVDGAPVPLLYGQVPLFRDLHSGVADGADVGELNADLGLPPSNHFSAATTAALQRWQTAARLAPTGTLAVGQAVVEPGPFRVDTVHASVGASLGSGAVLDATSTVLVVTAQLPLSDVGAVKPGDAVTIDLPNGHAGLAGRVRDLGASVTPPPSGSNGQGGQGQTPATTVPATLTFSDPSDARGLDQAAVLVHITTQTVHGVLAVPVDALLALAGGGEGVEIVSGTQHRVVAVTTGVFTGTQVQIDGAGITEGTQVEVPAG
jgi:hypothetical protein